MKFNLITLAVAVVFAGCSTTKNSESSAKKGGDGAPVVTVAPVSDTGASSKRPAPASGHRESTPESRQRMTTSFGRQGVQIEWDCPMDRESTVKNCADPEIRSIEASANGTAFGLTELQREAAFKVAEARAKARLAHFVREEIRSTNTVNTLARNVEKARSTGRELGNEDSVTMNDTESQKTPVNISDSSSTTAQTVSQTISTNSQLILRGVRVSDERALDARTVAVTVRWDRDSDSGVSKLHHRFLPQ